MERSRFQESRQSKDTTRQTQAVRRVDPEVARVQREKWIKEHEASVAVNGLDGRAGV